MLYTRLVLFAALYNVSVVQSLLPDGRLTLAGTSLIISHWD